VLLLGLENYKKALNDIIQIQGKNIQILKTGPTTMETAEQKKVALTSYDDKRVWYGVSHSEPYGMGGEDSILQLEWIWYGLEYGSYSAIRK